MASPSRPDAPADAKAPAEDTPDPAPTEDTEDTPDPAPADDTPSGRPPLVLPAGMKMAVACVSSRCDLLFDEPMLPGTRCPNCGTPQ